MNEEAEREMWDAVARPGGAPGDVKDLWREMRDVDVDVLVSAAGAAENVRATGELVAVADGIGAPDVVVLRLEDGSFVAYDTADVAGIWLTRP